MDQIIVATERLEAFPESGRRVAELRHTSYRELICGSYRILYRTADDVVWIVAIVHGRQMLPDLDGD